MAMPSAVERVDTTTIMLREDDASSNIVRPPISVYRTGAGDEFRE